MVPTLFALLAVAVLYWFPIRRWMNYWGATPADRARVMAGDSLLPDPTYSGTTAITVNAPPEHIWPWLVRIGYQRGGLLYPLDETRTQLVSRSYVRSLTLWARLFTHVIEPAGFVMTRRMLLGIKQRAEGLASSDGDRRGDRRAAA